MSLHTLKKWVVFTVVVCVFCIWCVLSLMGVRSLVVRSFLHATQPGIYFRQHSKQTPGRMATVVTAYFEIASKHTSAEYDTWMRNMLSLQDPMVIFTEEKFVDRFRQLRKHAGNRTKIVTTRLRDLKIAALFLPAAWSQQLAMDPEAKLHKSYQLFWVWLNKLSFMVQTVRDNPFASEIFVWADIGCFRDETYNGLLLVRNTGIISVDKMLLMAMKPPHNIDTSGGIVAKYDGVFDNSDFFTAGALLAGYKDTVVDMEKKFLHTIQIYRDRDLFIGDDQPLLQFTCVRNNLCEFVTPYHTRGNKWFGLQYALHTNNAVSMWRPYPVASSGHTQHVSRALLRHNDSSALHGGDTRCLNADFRAESERSVWTLLTEGDAYVRGAEKLGLSVLSNTHSPLDLVVMELESKPLSTSNWARLHAVGWKRCTVHRIAPTNEIATFPRFRDQFTKLHLWGMVMYKTVLYLDADTLVVQPIDVVLGTPLGNSFMAAGRDYADGQWRHGFNMGVFVVRPDRLECARLKRLQKFGVVAFETAMAEQGFLNVVYRDTWVQLPFAYNANLAVYVQDRVFWDSNIATIRIIHYTMTKPWACDNHYAPVCAMWLFANASKLRWIDSIN